MSSCDAIVIGAGHNGLAAAATLGRAGRKVVVLEAADEIGGAARTEEFAPGFRVSSVAHLLNRLHPDVVRALDLTRHGLAVKHSDCLPSVALSAEGKPLTLLGGYGERLEGASTAEQEAWRSLRAQLFRYAGILRPFMTRRPPDLSGALSLAEKFGLGQAALALRRLGREDMRDFLRMLLMNVADLLDEHLTDDRLKGLLSFDATLGSHLGPRSPTSLLGLYHRLTGEASGTPGGQMIPLGGMGALVAALASSARAAGVTIRTGTPVTSILVEDEAAVGVALADGEQVRAPAILSAINPATTMLELVAPGELDTGLQRRFRAIRMKGDAAKLHLALDRPPRFPGVDEAGQRGRLVIAASTDHVERAFNPAKYGEFSPEPVMEITLPSLSDPSLAPTGACVLSAVIQYAPYALREGWEAGKPKFLKAVLDQLENHSPGIGATILHTELLTPADIETRYRMPGGHWHHGELQADQMLTARPVVGVTGYDTPVDGLWLCGAGSHPGGGVSGVPGWNAARRVLGR